MMMEFAGRQAFAPTPMMQTPSMQTPSMLGQMGASALSGAERLLWEATERALRAPAGRLVVVLHLSRLAPPGPLPHHIRVARVLLQDSAARFGGQVFAMHNRDLVLLCSNGEAPNTVVGNPGKALSGAAAPPPVLPPETLPAAFARLFSAVSPGFGQLTSRWGLEKDAPSLLAYLG